MSAAFDLVVPEELKQKEPNSELEKIQTMVEIKEQEESTSLGTVASVRSELSRLAGMSGRPSFFSKISSCDLKLHHSCQDLRSSFNRLHQSSGINQFCGPNALSYMGIGFVAFSMIFVVILVFCLLTPRHENTFSIKWKLP